MNTTFLSLPSPAKVNLHLQILRRRADDYHDIQTVFQYLGLQDHLSFGLRQDHAIKLKTPLFQVKHEDNLIIKAAHLLQQQYDVAQGVDIAIDKHIPMGAGLGGGSSNAATTLLALNNLWRLHLPQDTLMKLGAQLGADVPFFIFGHAAWGEGIGEKLTPMLLPEHWYLLINPQTPISSGSLFNHPQLSYSQAPTTIEHFNPNQTINDFEPLILDNYPQIAAIFEWLKPYSRPRITGTGCVIYAAFDTREEASTIANLAPAFCQTTVTRGTNTSPLHDALAE